MITEPWAGRIHPGEVLVSNGSGAVVTGLVIGLIMGLGAIGSGDASPSSAGNSDDAGPVAATAPAPTQQRRRHRLGSRRPRCDPDDGPQRADRGLTFSSGPDPLYTPDILDILDTHGVKATFCILGTQAEEHPQLVEQIAAEGHVLCDHDDLRLCTCGARRRDDSGRDRGRPQRNPRGGARRLSAVLPSARRQFSAELVDIAASFDQASLGWNVDPRDWETPGAAAIRASVVDAVQPGSIVVLHDEGPNRGGTVEALPGIIEDLTAEGYQFVTPAS